MQVNLWGAINCIHAVLPSMIERQSGSIVSMSSDAGRMGEYREAVYSACKSGNNCLEQVNRPGDGPLWAALERGLPGVGCAAPGRVH